METDTTTAGYVTDMMTSPNVTETTKSMTSSRFTDSSITSIKTIVLPTIFSLVFVTGIIGNGLVIYIMKFKVRTRNITDLYILNLAVADFIFVAMLPFWTIELALNSRWVFGRVLCKLASASTLFHMYASVFFLAAMSVDRFIAVVLYQKCSKYRTKKTTTLGIGFIWFISTLLGLLPLYFRDTRFDRNTGVTVCEWYFRPHVDKSWFVMHFVTRSIIGFVVPFLIVLVCYSLIIVFLKTRETLGRLAGKCQDRATRMVMVVIAVFLVCWLPNQISNAVYATQSLGLTGRPKNKLIQYYIHMFSSCLAWMHSCFNPILYVFMREDMRLKLTEMLNYHQGYFRGNRIRNIKADLPVDTVSTTKYTTYQVTNRSEGTTKANTSLIKLENGKNSFSKDSIRNKLNIQITEANINGAVNAEDI